MKLFVLGEHSLNGGLCTETKLGNREVDLVSLLQGGASDCTAADVEAPWDIKERQDALWLEERGFRPRKLLQPDWTEADLQQFAEGVDQWYTGEAIIESDTMGMYYWLSHHVMKRRFSPKACQRQLQSQLRKLSRQGNMGGSSGPSVPVEAHSDSDFHSDSDSEDEVILRRGADVDSE